MKLRLHHNVLLVQHIYQHPQSVVCISSELKAAISTTTHVNVLLQRRFTVSWPRGLRDGAFCFNFFPPSMGNIWQYVE